jgi:hypothetical protein
MDYAQKLSNALDKEEETIAFLAFLPLSILEKKLLQVRRQLDIAQRNNILGPLELLKFWQKQLLDAKLLKAEFELEDYYDRDINFSLREVEEFEQIEKRQELLKQKLLKESTPETKHKTKTFPDSY